MTSKEVRSPTCPLGARSEAPGDLTGVINGRLDSWALWPTALSADDIAARRQRGLDEDDPLPDPAEVELYLGFEGPYPSIADSSNNGHIGVLTSHGNPGVAGVTGEGRAFRLLGRCRAMLRCRACYIGRSRALPLTWDAGMTSFSP